MSFTFIVSQTSIAVDGWGCDRYLCMTVAIAPVQASLVHVIVGRAIAIPAIIKMIELD